MSSPVVSVEGALRGVLKHGQKLLLAVSGGLDSMVLLHASAALSSEFGLTLAVAHLDHGLREESGADAEFVMAEAQRLGAQCHCRRATGPNPGENLEAWGRRQRYQWFGELIDQQVGELVLTAHTADDAAETLLMRLVSNKELRGIAPFDSNRHLLRPLLLVPRVEMERYQQEHKISFRADHTNEDLRFLRNRVRHCLLPLLRTEFDPKMVAVLAERANHLQELYDWLDYQSAINKRQLELEVFGSRLWLLKLRDLLSDLPVAARHRLVADLLIDKLGFRLGRKHTDRLVRFFMGADEGIQLPRAVSLRRKDGGIILG